MTIEILNKSDVVTPASGFATLFLDAQNNNALTAKYDDCTFRVLSAEPYQLTTSQSLLDAQNDILNNLSCAVAKGTISVADYQTFINSFNLYYTSFIDANGNLSQSITTSQSTTPTPIVEDFTIYATIPSNDENTVIPISVANGVASTPDVEIVVDRNFVDDDLTCSIDFIIPSADGAMSLSVTSQRVNSAGGIITSGANIIQAGTSRARGEFSYNGASIGAGSYVGLLTVTNGTISRYKIITLTVTP
jgi:hypothetical protein